MHRSEKTTKYHLKTPEDFQAGSGTFPTYKQLGLAYMTNSTTHGVPHSLKATGGCKTTLWLLCLLAGLAAFGVNLTYLVTKYLQYLPSTRIIIYNDRILPFPAVTICNTNPIKSSAVSEDARLVALLESWGVIEVTGNTTRRKRKSLDPDCVAEVDAGLKCDINEDKHHISKRATSECSFIKVYDASDGLSSRCSPYVSLNQDPEEDCPQAACDYAAAGNEEYNVILYRNGCFVRPCSVPFDNSTLLLSADYGGRAIYVRAYNECLSDPCIYGQCKDTDLYYQCICDAGYTGFNCDTVIIACDSGPCDNGGTCQATATSYNCTCPSGFHGVDCSLVSSGYNQYPSTSCTGEDLLPSVTQSVAECEAVCDATIGCIAFSYITSTSVCALRAQCLTMAYEDGTTAFVKYAPSDSYSAYIDIDCPGNDFKSIFVLSVWDCSRECDEIVSCVAIVFKATDSKCYIKSMCDTSALVAKDPSLEFTLYLKTGRAAVCSLPRARISCPGEFGGITEVECLALTSGCCYDDSQANVAWCYLDTLYNLQHNHIHTVLRAAQKAPASPVLYNLWVGNGFTPDLESEVHTEYYSREDSETEVYKSPIVECVWDRAIAAYTMVYADHEEKMYFKFNATGQEKVNWYSASQLMRTSYTDASSLSTYNYFSVDGDAVSNPIIRRRWYINHQYEGCPADSGWFVVIDTDQTPVCTWENLGGEYPQFMYSELGTEDISANFLFAETFFTKVELDDEDLGGSCVSSCLYLSDGSYQSCLGCNVYILCTSQVLTYHVCHQDQRFDTDSGSCQDVSATCTGSVASGKCMPTNECETNTECLNGGTCSMASNGWECLCVTDYAGRYCQNCAATGMAQVDLAWTVDDWGTVFADGVVVSYNLNWGTGEVVTLPCSTSLVAFSPINIGGNYGLVASYSDKWSTGDDGSLRCSSDPSLATSDDWKLYAYDDSAWEVPTVITNHGDAPWGTIANINSAAKWVWTSDGVNEIYCRLALMEPDPTTTEPEPTTTEPEQTTTEPEPTTSEPEPTTTETVTQTTTPTTTTYMFISNFPEREEYREDFLKEEDIIALLAEIDDDTKRRLGYTLNDMVTECDFDGQPCVPSDFSWFFDAVYGNCYVFNSGWEITDNTTDFESKQQGYLHGLTIALDIGQYEYIQDVGEAAGAVVVVHNPDDMPFPEDEGILAVPGRLTSVGIKKVDVHRLPEPHGECEENIERNTSRSLFEEHYPVKYSLSSCYITCYQIHVVETCGCGDPQYPIEGKVFEGKVVVPCNARNMTQDDCKYSVTKKYINDELECDCPNPCQESSYEYKVSSADWPSKTSEASVFRAVRAKLAMVGVTGLTDDQIKRNLVKIQVFFESHSFERLLEYPAYKLAKLFWDIGGIMGLWLGCSVLSIVELLELAVDALVLLCYKLTKRKYWALPVRAGNNNKNTKTTNTEGTNNNNDSNNKSVARSDFDDLSIARSFQDHNDDNNRTNYNGASRPKNRRTIKFATDGPMLNTTDRGDGGETNQSRRGEGGGRYRRRQDGIGLPSTVEVDGNSSEEESEHTSSSAAANGGGGTWYQRKMKIPGYMLGNVTARKNINDDIVW